MTRWHLIVSVAVAFAVGCAPSADEQIADSKATGPATWRLSDAPRVSIGVVEGDERYQLFRVNSGWRHADGRIILFDPGKPALLFYDSTGVFLSQIGSRGRGPGEFQTLAFAWPYRGDSVAVYDVILRRLSVFDADGKFTRSFINPYGYKPKPGTTRSGSASPIVASFADGSFVLSPPNEIPNGAGPPRYGTKSAIRISPDGTKQDTIGTFESALYRHDPARPNGIRGYETSYHFRYTAIGNDLVGGNGLAGGLIAVVKSAGRTDLPDTLLSTTLDTVPLPGEARPFTAELKAEYETALRADYEARGSNHYEGSLESYWPQDYADIAPRFVGILSDADHQIWLERWSPQYGRLGAPLEYDVITMTGRHVASMKLPTGARVLWSGRGQILLLEKDSLDVQHVRLYDIVSAPRL